MQKVVVQFFSTFLIPQPPQFQLLLEEGGIALLNLNNGALIVKKEIIDPLLPHPNLIQIDFPDITLQILRFMDILL